MATQLTVNQAQKLSGLAQNTIRNWIDDEKLKNKNKDAEGKVLINQRELLSLIPTILTIFNRKGGIGKTSLSVLLGDYYDKKGIKTLIVDFDPQCNLSETYFTYDELKESLTSYDYFERGTSLLKIAKKYNSNIDILPSHEDLENKNYYDINDLDKKKNDFIPLFKKYQIIIIDCPPSINSLTKFGLMLANYCFIPVVPEPYSYDGLFKMINLLNDIKKYCEYFIDFKVIISDHEQRTIRIQEKLIDVILNEIKDKAIKYTIPSFVGIKERPIDKINIFDHFKMEKKQMPKIIKVMDFIDNFIYDERKING